MLGTPSGWKPEPVFIYIYFFKVFEIKFQFNIRLLILSKIMDIHHLFYFLEEGFDE